MSDSVVVQTPFKEHVANGLSTTFAYDFQVLEEADLKVYADSVLVASSEYTANGIGAQNGGAIIFDTAPANGVKVLISREIALARATEYQTLGDFKASVVNPDFNRLWMALQGQLVQLNRSVRVPYPLQLNELPGDPADFDGYYLGFLSGQPTYLLAPSGTAAAVAGDLANSSDAAKGDALLAVKRSETGVVATTQHVVNQERPLSLVADVGAAGDGTTDDSAKMVTAAASGAKIIDGGGRTYRVVTKFTIATAGQRWQNMTLKFDGANTTRICDVTGTDVTLLYVTFDGNNKQPRASLVYVDANAARFKALYCVEKDMYGTAYGATVLNQMCALNINPYGVTDFLILGCQFRNLRKVNDGSLTPAAIGLGFVGGIYFLPEDLGDPSASQPTPTSGEIIGCTFDTIQTILAGALTDNQVADYDDADAIRTYAGTGAKKLNVRVSSCKFINVSKRAMKFRASGSVASDCEIYAAGNAYGMSTALDLVHNCTAENIKLFTTSALPAIKVVTVSIGGDAPNEGTVVRDIWASHCKEFVEVIGVSGQALKKFTLDGLECPSVSVAGVLQIGGGATTTHEDLILKRVRFTGSGNNCQGLLLSLAADNTSGWTVDDVVLVNADYKVEGAGWLLNDITVRITSTSFAGSSSTRAVAELGSGKGLGGVNKASDLLFDLRGINTSYTSASRPYLIFAASDNMKLQGVDIVTPDGLSTTYPHLEAFGDDSELRDLNYTGVGYLRMGHLTASSRWGVRGATRHGSGACTQSFWSLNSASQYYEFDDITDWRPTNQTTVVSVTATNGIASNIRTRSSAGTPTVSGVAKTGGVLNTF